jgi:cardiolipin synthase
MYGWPMRSRNIARANMNSFRSRAAIAVFFLGPLFFSGCALKIGKQARQEVTSLYSASSPEFRQSAGSLLGPNFVSGNNITTLVNGKEIFPAMLSAIRLAKHSINFETYVFWDGEIGREFTEALAERAAAGVHVNAILDAQGTQKMGTENRARLREAGVEVVKYHRAFFFDPRRYNNRTHRKLLIVDGKVAFLGGAGIADQWTGNAESPQHWRDNHYKLTGPVVAQLQAIFLANWLKTRGNVLHGDDYFPPLPKHRLIPRPGAQELSAQYESRFDVSPRDRVRTENAPHRERLFFTR